MAMMPVFLPPSLPDGTAADSGPDTADAPASAPDWLDNGDMPDMPHTSGPDRGRGRTGGMTAGSVQMTRSAIEAAARLGVTAEQVSATIAEATEVRPDRDRPERTRFRRGTMVVVTGRDGVVLAVYVNR